MDRKAIILSHGLHPPWNMGEAVLARNFTRILARLYSDLVIFSTKDGRRGSLPDIEDYNLQLDANYYHDERKLKAAVIRELNTEPNVDVHFLRAPLLSSLSILKKVKKAYLYQFAYNIHNNPSLIMRSIGALLLTYLNSLRVITTAPKSYKHFHRFFVRHYHYIPAPIDLPSHIKSPMNKFDDKLKLLYLGHGSYLRFPYERIFKALLRLQEEGCRVELNVYISELSYVNYPSFIKSFKGEVEKHGLETLVRLHLGNLSEAKKWKIIGENDILLFPSLVNAAIDPPLIILEAMLMGKCVIATPVQSVPYLLGYGKGVIVSKQSLEYDLYRVLRMFSNNRKLLEKYGMRAKKWAIKVHSVNTACDRMKKILNEDL